MKSSGHENSFPFTAPRNIGQSFHPKEFLLNRTATEWYHCSSYGTVLMHIAANPHSTTNEIADALCLTRRSVWGTIGALRQRGQIHVVRIGRKNHYYVNMDAPFLHPTIEGVKLGDLIKGLEDNAATIGCRN
jgi:hypothetical protein